MVEGESLFAGLNSFEPGQEHAAHSHEGQDKLYLILEGSGMVQVGDQSELLSAGDAAFALSLITRLRELGLGIPGLIFWQLVEGRRLFRARFAGESR